MTLTLVLNLPKNCYAPALSLMALLSRLETETVWLCRHCIILRTAQFVNGVVQVLLLNLLTVVFLCFYILAVAVFTCVFMFPITIITINFCRRFDHRPSLDKLIIKSKCMRSVIFLLTCYTYNYCYTLYLCTELQVGHAS